jgi:molybdate transport system substrate-binding protein
MRRLAALLILAMGVASSASSADMPATLTCVTSVEGAIRELEAAMRAKVHMPITITSGGSAQGQRRLENGEAADIGILPKEAMQQLAAKGLVKVQVDLALSDVGVAVAADAPTPVLRTAEDFAQLLRATPTLAYTTGASGQHLSQVIEKLGLTEVVKPKATVVGANSARLVLEGKVAAAVQQIGELRLEGARNVVPLPEALQMHTIVTVAVMNNAPHPQAAADMLRVLTSPTAVPVYQRWGVVPLYR